MLTMRPPFRKISLCGFHSLTVAVALTAIPALDARANTLAIESFSDYSAPSNLNGAGGGMGWENTWAVGNPSQGFLNEVRNPYPFSYTGYNGSTTPAASGGNFLNLASGFGSDVYNFAIRTLDVDGAFSAYDSGGLIGAENTTLWGSMLYSSSDANGHLRLRNNDDVDRIDINLLSGDNNLLVFRITFGALNSDTISVWNNPVAPFDSSSTASNSVADFSFSKFFVFRDTAEGEIRLDDIRFGNSSSDVVPVVPEPATATLLGLSAMALLGRRRSRNARG